jgi:hypothetical protein
MISTRRKENLGALFLKFEIPVPPEYLYPESSGYVGEYIAPGSESPAVACGHFNCAQAPEAPDYIDKS